MVHIMLTAAETAPRTPRPTRRRPSLCTATGRTDEILRFQWGGTKSDEVISMTEIHPDPIWNDGALGFLKRSRQQR